MRLTASCIGERVFEIEREGGKYLSKGLIINIILYKEIELLKGEVCEGERREKSLYRYFIELCGQRTLERQAKKTEKESRK